MQSRKNIDSQVEPSVHVGNTTYITLLVYCSTLSIFERLIME